jgi:hypothetical protein
MTRHFPYNVHCPRPPHRYYTQGTSRNQTVETVEKVGESSTKPQGSIG